MNDTSSDSPNRAHPFSKIIRRLEFFRDSLIPFASLIVAIASLIVAIVTCLVMMRQVHIEENLAKPEVSVASYFSNDFTSIESLEVNVDGHLSSQLEVEVFPYLYVSAYYNADENSQPILPEAYQQMLLEHQEADGYTNGLELQVDLNDYFGAWCFAIPIMPGATFYRVIENEANAGRAALIIPGLAVEKLKECLPGLSEYLKSNSEYASTITRLDLFIRIKYSDVSGSEHEDLYRCITGITEGAMVSPTCSLCNEDSASMNLFNGIIDTFELGNGFEEMVLESYGTDLYSYDLPTPYEYPLVGIVPDDRYFGAIWINRSDDASVFHKNVLDAMHTLQDEKKTIAPWMHGSEEESHQTWQRRW